MTSSVPQAPAKIQGLLDYAAKLGLVVGFDPRTTSWEIKSSDPHDRDRIWIYWSGPGPNGGRTFINLYRPHAVRVPSRMTKQTAKGARTWMRVLSR